jgi:hypothetical protein
MKAPIFKEENVVGHVDLLKQLNDAMLVLEDAMKASIPLKR